MVSAAQLRAARGILDWTRADLAKAANVSPETIKNIEHGTFRPQEATTEAIIRAFAAHDVVFTENEGVQRRRDVVETFNGKDGFRYFFDNVFETIKSDSSPVCISGVDEELFMYHLGDYHAVHASRMAQIGPVSVRSLIKEGDTNFACSTYSEYRWVHADYFKSVPFYLYGNKLAIIIFNDRADVNVVVINSALVASAYRAQFEIMWDEAHVPEKNGRGKP